MPAFESIVVVEDWISEHYFTTDGKGATFQKQVTELRKGWDADAKEGHLTIAKKFSAVRGEMVTELAALDELDDVEASSRSRVAYALLRKALGIAGVPSPLAFERGSANAEVEGLWLGDTRDVLWLEGMPAGGDDALTESRALGLNLLDGKERSHQPLAKLISELYLSEPSPKYIVVSAGSSLFLTDRERWPEGRYLVADVQLIADRNDTKKAGETDRLLAIFGRQSIMPGPDGAIWWDERLEESRQHAVGVSQDLRDGIRESIEIIANDVLTRRTAAGLDNDDVDGQVLARQSLRFLYRILFLLYAEASPELGVLPKNQGEYDAGYGLERLRELVQVELPSLKAQQGTHLFDSLDLLFRLVNGDHEAQRTSRARDDAEAQDAENADSRDEGLTFEPLEADLFAASATGLIGEVGLSNAELQRVLERLLLSKAGSKGERGFISYANLGINQLGAVYEGLMSYTGFIAQEDLGEVAKNGDSSKGSWVVPVDRIDGIEPKHFVTRRDEETGLSEPVHHPRGSFVFRLAGRERQQSASYYTPEVMTKFVVSQALEEFLQEDTPADTILELSICEPALGSGAFAIEAVRQLAGEYLKRKQKELDREIPADEYPQELQRVKAQIALHQVYGVDLNATAVELAEVSLWLDTMQPGLSAPWFGLRLKRGNSLVGARRATYSVDAVKSKKYLTDEPQANPMSGLVNAMARDDEDLSVVGRIHHFLLPGEGWGSAADVKELKDIAAEEQKRLKTWAKGTRLTLKKPQIDRLKALSERVEALWKIALRRLQIADAQARRFIDYWPHESAQEATAITRAEIESALNDANGAYQRLKRVMNAWNALWFWPLTESGVEPPAVDEWINALEGILGLRGKVNRFEGQKSFVGDSDWHELNAYEDLELGLATVASFERLAERHRWLAVCDRIAEEQGFFHWELEFASVFGSGGFDLQVGNPPWVRPRSDEAALLAEHDAWWQLTEKPAQAVIRRKRTETLALPGAAREFIDAATPTPVLAEFLGASSQYSVLAGLQPDLYRAFMARTWMGSSRDGVVALLHPESHFTEKKAQNLRAATYRRLRRHWQFINELSLFEIHHLVAYGVHVYGAQQEAPRFQMAASLYHPDTVVRSLEHEGGTEIPGLKTAEGKWDTRPHPERIVNVDLDVLKVWADILDEPGTSPLHARMVYPVNRASMSVLEKLSKAPRVRELGLSHTSGWHETNGRKAGYFDVGSKTNALWDDVILQGPHFSVANPFAKQPNASMKHNLDWVDIDLEALPPDFIPRTNYQRLGTRGRASKYESAYSQWKKRDGTAVSSSRFKRIAISEYVGSVTGNRTLQPALIPEGATHINAVNSYGFPDDEHDFELGLVGAALSSIPIDFWVRLIGSGHIYRDTVMNLPLDATNAVVPAMSRRFLQLSPLGLANDTKFVRLGTYRWQLLVEIDALSALMFGLTADELSVIYRTQFPVAQRYALETYYDRNGRLVPTEIGRLYRKGGEEGMELADREWTHPQSDVEYTFEFPFHRLDREEDMRAAYAKFSTMLEEHGEILEEA